MFLYNLSMIVKYCQKSARYDFLQRPLITADSDEEEDSDEGDN